VRLLKLWPLARAKAKVVPAPARPEKPAEIAPGSRVRIVSMRA
jgi:hypothetical protein